MRGIALLAALPHRPARAAGARPGRQPPPPTARRPGAAPAPAQSDDPAALVARIALYPDDLVAIILPASTNPLQIVQAERFLAKRKTDPKAPIDEKWDDSVKSLVNYPEVITMMSGDLDWTAALGEAVVADQAAVLEAIQAFRRKTQAAGNLKIGSEADGRGREGSDHDRADRSAGDLRAAVQPDHGGGQRLRRLGLLPVALPVYYYPYPPGAAFATGLIWGAAIGAVWGGARYGANYGGGDININRNTNINTGDINSGNRGSGNRADPEPAARSGARASRRAR